MTFLTALALRRRSVTILLVAMVLGGGIVTYNNLQVELFPEIQFPLVTVMTFYPSANPEAVVRDVTVPIENALSGVEGLDNVQSISSENLSLLLVNFKFGTDMAGAQRTIAARLSGIRFPVGVEQPRVARISPNEFPVLQLSVAGDRPIPELQRLVESQIRPAILGVDGVLSADVTGGVDQQVFVTVDPDRLSELGLSLFQVSSALSDNNVTFPAGAITSEGRTFPVRTAYSYDSLEEIRNLVVGSAGAPPFAGVPSAPPASGAPPVRQVLVSDVADVTLGVGAASSISRTNGSPSLGIGVLKDPDANTVEVTRGVLEAIAALHELLPDVRIETILNDGPEIQAQVDTLQREAFFRFPLRRHCCIRIPSHRAPHGPEGIPARPQAHRGDRTVHTPQHLHRYSSNGDAGHVLELHDAGGTRDLCRAGRRRQHRGAGERVPAHSEGRRSARGRPERNKGGGPPAIVASTMTTIVVFVPLGFIQGLVGSFFTPFALTVSFALIASLLVALTAVPVLGAILVRPGDLPEGALREEAVSSDETWMQRAYAPVLLWALRHKLVTLLSAAILTVGSLGLIAIIPITLFPSGGPRFLAIDMSLPPGTSHRSHTRRGRPCRGGAGHVVEPGCRGDLPDHGGKSGESIRPGCWARRRRRQSRQHLRSAHR